MPNSIPTGFEICPMPDGGFAATIGPLLIRRMGERLRFAFQATARHSNGRDVVHGGMLLTFADQVLGLTVQRVVGSIDVATVSLNCDFIASARPGELIEGEATVTRATKSVVFAKGSLYRGDTVLMNASGLWMCLRRVRTEDR